MDYTEKLLKQTSASIKEASSDFSSIGKALSNLSIDGTDGLDHDKPLPYIDLPFSLIELRLRSIPGQIAALPSRIPLSTIPTSLLTGIRDAASDVATRTKDLKTLVDNVQSNGGFNTTTWSNIVIANKAGSFSGELVQNFLQPILKRTDQLLLHYAQLLLLVKPDALKFQYAVENAAKAEAAANDSAAKALESSAAAAAEAASAAEFATKVEAVHDQVQALEGAVKKIRDDIATIEGDTRSKKADADSTLTAASALKKQVDEFAASFEAFQKTLDDKNTTWAKGNEYLSTLTANLTKQEERIEDIVHRANSMLATATNAGLTAAQDAKFNELAKELKSAGDIVYLSYAILFVSLTPLGLYIFNNMTTTIQFSGGWVYFGNVLLRAFLLVPSLLFVRFATLRYRRLFRLKHEYGYRASLAGAVEGFKTQAPDHGQDIAAVAFYQLGRNPAQAIDGQEEIPSWYAKLLQIIERFGDRFGMAEKTTAD